MDYITNTNLYQMTTAEKLSKIQFEFKAKKSRYNSFRLFLYNEQLSLNWSEPKESDCLIKTKHCDGLIRL